MDENQTNNMYKMAPKNFYQISACLMHTSFFMAFGYNQEKWHWMLIAFVCFIFLMVENYTTYKEIAGWATKGKLFIILMSMVFILNGIIVLVQPLIGITVWRLYLLSCVLMLFVGYIFPKYAFFSSRKLSI